MKVTHFPCGPAANESELKAFEHLKNRIQNEPGDGHWVLLTNLAFSVTHQLQSDEIDIVAIGPSGDLQRGEYTTVARFLDQATHADPEQRVMTARDALRLLKEAHEPRPETGGPSAIGG